MSFGQLLLHSHESKCPSGLCLLVHFESYTGPPIGFDLPGIDPSKIVPVYPSRRSQVQPSTSTRS